MDNYTFVRKVPNFGTHTIKYTLQFGEYIGTFTVKLGGNCGGRDTLKGFDFENCSLSDDADKVDFEYEELDDEYLRIVLTNPKNGNTLEIEEEFEEFNNYIVKAEIIDFVED